MLLRANLTSPEIYSIAMDQASEAVPRHNPTIRLNHMIATGDLALQLANVGRPLVREGTVMSDYDLLPHYVYAGASLSFDLLRRVIDPSNRALGPGNFSVTACDSEGRIITASDDSTGLAFNGSQGARDYAVGEYREDYWQSVAVGIASKIAEGKYTKTRRVQRAAEVAAGQGGAHQHAYDILAMAAVHADRLVRANEVLFAGSKGLDTISLAVLVEPVAGYQVPATVSYEKVIALEA